MINIIYKKLISRHSFILAREFEIRRRESLCPSGSPIGLTFAHRGQCPVSILFFFQRLDVCCGSSQPARRRPCGIQARRSSITGKSDYPLITLHQSQAVARLPPPRDRIYAARDLLLKAIEYNSTRLRNTRRKLTGEAISLQINVLHGMFL